MATSCNLADKITKSFDQFECPICKDTFVDPRVLSCLHSFCNRCLKPLLNTIARRHDIKCPVCKRVTKVPNGEVDKLQVNFILNNLMSEVALHKETQTKDSLAITCEKCVSGDPAILRCRSCGIFLCDVCSKAHKRDTTTCSHVLVTFEELKSLGPSALSKPLLCKVHDGMHLKLYCESCEQVICTDCALIQHRNHKYDFVTAVYTKEEEDVTQLLEETKTKQTLLRDALEGVVEMSLRVQEAGKNATQEINATVDGLIQAIETVRMKLLHQAGEIQQGKLKRLEIQKEELEVALSSVTSSVEFSEKALRDGNQVEVLSMKKHMMERLHESNSEARVLKPCTDEVISYHAKPLDKQDVLNTLGRVLNLRITLQMEAGKAGVVYNTLINQTRDFIVITRDLKGEQIREDSALINVEIKEPNNLNPKVVPVQDCGDGRYTFSYKPVCVGNYQVSVKVNGNNIRGSPFTWMVEQWHLVARNREDKELTFSQSNMTVEKGRVGEGKVVGSCGFTGGCHSWKVNVVSDKGFWSAGVTDFNVEPAQQKNTWFWFNGSKYHVCNGKYTGSKPSNIPVFNPNDVIIVYLDNDLTLTLHHLASDKTDTFTTENTTLYPYFYLGFGYKLTLLV